MAVMQKVKGLLRKVYNKIKRLGKKEEAEAENRYSFEESLIEQSDLFDKEWYCRKYLQSEEKDPVCYFTNIGWKLGHNPSPWFSTKDYLEEYHDVKEAGMNPLVHYEKSGREEFRIIRYIDEEV